MVWKIMAVMFAFAAIVCGVNGSPKTGECLILMFLCVIISKMAKAAGE